MIAQPMAEFSGETVRNIAGALIWWARPTERPEVLNVGTGPQSRL